MTRNGVDPGNSQALRPTGLGHVDVYPRGHETRHDGGGCGSAGTEARRVARRHRARIRARSGFMLTPWPTLMGMEYSLHVTVIIVTVLNWWQLETGRVPARSWPLLGLAPS